MQPPPAPRSQLERGDDDGDVEEQHQDEESKVEESALPSSPKAESKRKNSDGDADTLHLHAIDMSREDDDVLVAEIMEQMESVGFLTINNVSGYDEEAYHSACKALHALSPALKRSLYLKKDEPANENLYRGYQPFLAEENDAGSHKEFFDQGFPPELLPPEEAQLPLYEPTPQPDAPELAWIFAEFENARAAWYAAAMRIIGLLAQGLDKPATFFDPWFLDGSLTTMRTIHYEPRSSSGAPDRAAAAHARLTTPAHADSGFLTFLATFGYPGLQVLHAGRYRSVSTASTGTLVVNLGDLLARISNYRLKATFHRVLDTGAERFSSPMFLEPKYSARVPRGLLASPRTAVDEDVPDDAPMYGDWIVRRMMASFAEWAGFQVPVERRDFVDAVELSEFTMSGN